MRVYLIFLLISSVCAREVKNRCKFRLIASIADMSSSLSRLCAGDLYFLIESKTVSKIEL